MTNIVDSSTINDDAKNIEQILFNLLTEYLEIDKALKNIPYILKGKIKFISDTSDNVLVIASNKYPNKDIDVIYNKAKEVLWLTKEYVRALEDASERFEVILKYSEISSDLYKDLIISDYRLITDEDKVKQILIKALGNGII